MSFLGNECLISVAVTDHIGSIVMQCRYASQLSSQTSVIIEVVAELTSDN